MVDQIGRELELEISYNCPNDAANIYGCYVDLDDTRTTSVNDAYTVFAQQKSPSGPE